MAVFDPNDISEHVWKQMNITRERFLEIRGVMEEREKGAPEVGSPAPDFSLWRLSRNRRLSDARISLSGLRGRAVALVFGSYT